MSSKQAKGVTRAPSPGKEARTRSVIVPCGPTGVDFPGNAVVPGAGMGRE